MMIREHTIDMKDIESASRTSLEMMKQSLVDCRMSTSKPEELEWEIRLYDFMLLDPVKRYAAYRSARAAWPGKIVPKREVAKQLGWDVP